MRNGKILILEADRHLRLSWARALSRKCYHVTGVSSTKKAVKAANQQSYELLIISVAEPELLNMLLAKFPRDLSVLIMATEDRVSRIVECSGAGIHSFLIQPFSLAKLKATVAQIIDGARMVKESFRSKVLMNLEHVNRLLASETEIDNVFKLVTEISAADTKADYASLLIRNEATGKFVTRAWVGEHKPNWKKVCQRVMNIGKPILIDETTQNSSHLHKLVTEAGISSILCVPLIANGKMIGAINNIKVAKRARFMPADMAFNSILSWWSSIALENTRLRVICKEQRLHVEKLLQEMSLALENERTRVATDIHDSVVQWMLSALYRMRATNALISESRLDGLGAELTMIENTLQKSIIELRRIIVNLRPVKLEEQGLVAALRQAMEMLNEEGIKCYIKVDRKLPILTPAEESTIYRIVQEALTNIRKHSQATDVRLYIKSRDSSVSVTISDNGKGFNTDEVMNSKIPLVHLGLLGMKERVELLRGNLSIDSKPGMGSSIGFTFPVSSPLTMKTEVQKR